LSPAVTRGDGDQSMSSGVTGASTAHASWWLRPAGRAYGCAPPWSD